MENLKKSAILNGLGVIGIVGGTTALVLTNILSAWAFVLAAIACYPMAKVIRAYIGKVRHNTIRILRKLLPKIGFVIEDTEWNDDHSQISFRGKFQGETFLIQASNRSETIQIGNAPWAMVKATDPDIPRILEAINDVNGHRANLSIFMYEPNEEGERYIATQTRTIIPTYHSADYLNYIFVDLLYRRVAFDEAMNKERPYMNQRQCPIGFRAPQPSAQAEEPVEAAARTDLQVHN